MLFLLLSLLSNILVKHDEVDRLVFFRQQQYSLHFTFLVSLMDKVGLQKNSCKIIDVTNKRGTVETLTEAKISCAIEEKVCNS